MPAQLLQDPLELAVLPGLQQIGYQPGNGKEPYPSALSTGCKTQGYSQVGFTGTAVAGQQDVLPPIDILTAGQRCLTRDSLIEG